MKLGSLGTKAYRAGSGFAQAYEGSGGHPTWVPTAAGAAVGGAAGGIGMYEYSEGKIHSEPAHTVTVDGSSVTLDGHAWTDAPQGNFETPVTKEAVIGQAPQDQYLPTWGGWFPGWSSYSGLGWYGSVSTGTSMENVTRNTPVLDGNGKAETQEQSASYHGNGVPVFNWESHPIQQPYLGNPPWYASITPDTSQSCTYVPGEYHPGYTDPGYYDSSGNYHEGESHPGYTDPGTNDCHDVTNGYWLNYYPNVEERSVQTESGATTYETPKVSWDTGVHEGLNTTAGAVGGLLIGGVTGYLLGRAFSH